MKTALFFLCIMLFSPLSWGQPEHRMDRIIAEIPKLPDGEQDFYYRSRSGQDAYVANVISIMAFGATNYKKNGPFPTMILDVPEYVEINGVLRNIKIEAVGDILREGQKYKRYKLIGRLGSAKWEIFWVSSARPGTKGRVYYHSEYNNLVRPEKSLSLTTLFLPKTRVFKKIPVYFSSPSDELLVWNSPDALKRGGFNAIDLWAYLHPNQRGWGAPMLDKLNTIYSEEGIEIRAWTNEWWWANAIAQPEGKATDIDGKKVNVLNFLYRGKWFEEWLNVGRILIDHKIFHHTVDPEIYRSVDRALGYSKAAKLHFKNWLEMTGKEVTEADPSVFMLEKNKPNFSKEIAFWREWRAQRFTNIFVDYRKAMISYMKEKGLDSTRFKFGQYSTYHRAWDGFYEYLDTDYKKSPVYRLTLEDPVDNLRAFDEMAPMNYPDLYGGNSGVAAQRDRSKYNMLEPFQDTFAMVSLVADKGGVVTPILSSGYPFTYYGSDLSTEMLKYNIYETIIGGAKGFGIWGATPHDAKDMQMMGALVDSLVDSEDLILAGTPKESKPMSGTAFVKELHAPEGVLILVSEYSKEVYDLVIKSPIKGRVIDIEKDKIIGDVEAGGTFSIRLSERRAILVKVEPGVSEEGADMGMDLGEMTHDVGSGKDLGSDVGSHRDLDPECSGNCETLVNNASGCGCTSSGSSNSFSFLAFLLFLGLALKSNNRQRWNQ